MKRLFILFSIIGVLVISEKTFCMPWPPEMDICYVKFNYDSGSYTYDALTLKKNNSTTITAPEWANGGSTNEKIAYTMNQSNRKIKVQLWLDRTGIEVGVYATPSGQGIGNTYTQFFDFYSSQYSSEKIMTFNGSVPSSVGKRNLTLQWYATFFGQGDDSYYWIGNTGSHYYYTLLAAPQSPMSTPWTSVLDYACVWASGKTSSSSAATEITDALNTSGFNYAADSGLPRYDDSYDTFNLTQFLSELGDSYSVNCLDMAKAVVTFSNSIGSGLNLTTYGHIGSFPLNCINPIGTASPTNNPFSSPLIHTDCRQGSFDYHAFAEQTSNNNVWDATLKYDIDSDPDNVTGSNPGCGSVTTGHNWQLPSDESESTYISRLIDEWTYDHSYNPQWHRNRAFTVH